MTIGIAVHGPDASDMWLLIYAHQVRLHFICCNFFPQCVRYTSGCYLLLCIFVFFSVAEVVKKKLTADTKGSNSEALDRDVGVPAV